MKASVLPIRRPTSLGLLALALARAISLFVLVAAPQADAARPRLDGLKPADFRINVTGAPDLPAVASGGARAVIADLDLGSAEFKTSTKRHRTYRTVTNVGVTLNATATGAINATFRAFLHDNVFLGTANV